MNLTVNKLRELFITAYLILVPLWYRPTFSRENQENFFQFMAIGMVGFFVGNVWLGSFLILNVLLFIYNGAEIGFGQVLNVMFGCLIFTFSRYFFKNNKSEIIYRPLLIVLCVTLVWMVLQLFNIDPLFQPADNRGMVTDGPLGDPLGFFGLKAANATFIAICMPILASMSAILCPILALFLLVPIAISKASAVYVAVVPLILFYTWYLHRRFFKIFCLVLPILAIAFVVLDFHTDSKTFKSRFVVWHSAINYALHNPIGYGPDSYRNYNKHKDFKFVGDNFYNHALIKDTQNGPLFRYYSASNDNVEVKRLTDNIKNTSINEGKIDFWDSPHNMYINLFFQYGVIGLILLGGLLREMWFRFKYAMKDKELIVLSSCILVYLIVGIFHFPLDIARTGFLFPILLGAYYAKTDERTI